MAKVRVTMNNARGGKNGVFQAKHLDSKDGKAAKMGGLLKTYQRYQKKQPDMTFEQAEAKFYRDNFQAGLDAQNERYRKKRNYGRMRDMDAYRTGKATAPESTLFYLGDKDNNAGPSVLLSVFDEYQRWQSKQFPNVVLLDFALHKEEGAYHVHRRQVYIGHDADGNRIAYQEGALAEMGIQPPKPLKPGEKPTRYNNAKMTFTEVCRDKLTEIAKAHGVEIITKPREAGEKGLTQARYKTKNEQEKAEAARKEVAAAESKLSGLSLESAQVDMKIRHGKHKLEQMDEEQARKRESMAEEERQHNARMAQGRDAETALQERMAALQAACDDMEGVYKAEYEKARKQAIEDARRSPAVQAARNVAASDKQEPQRTAAIQAIFDSLGK